jgi:hypothetical protein
MVVVQHGVVNSPEHAAAAAAGGCGGTRGEVASLGKDPSREGIAGGGETLEPVRDLHNTSWAWHIQSHESLPRI